jgi:hypothetical protein
MRVIKGFSCSRLEGLSGFAPELAVNGSGNKTGRGFIIVFFDASPASFRQDCTRSVFEVDGYSGRGRGQCGVRDNKQSSQDARPSRYSVL